MRLDDADLSLKLDDKAYEKRLGPLQHQMRTIELAYRRSGARACIVFEGWDAAGKGGTIRRMTAEMDPRGFQVWPISAPSVAFAQRHYLERFWQRLPGPGVIGIFDRSWYGRVLVERVERLASDLEWRRAYDEINHFEQMLVADGVRIVKLFLHLSQEQQLKRFKARYEDPWKRWKLTAEDFRNAGKRTDYEAAIDDMLAQTHADNAPWAVIAAEDKRFARIAALEMISNQLSQGLDLSPPDLDPEVTRLARDMFGD